MIQPESELPWTVSIDNTAGLYDKNKNCFLITDDNYSNDDINYIIEACNNYQKAVELLNRFLKFNESNYKDLNVEFDINYDTKQFLKSIE